MEELDWFYSRSNPTSMDQCNLWTSTTFDALVCSCKLNRSSLPLSQAFQESFSTASWHMHVGDMHMDTTEPRTLAARDKNNNENKNNKESLPSIKWK